MRANRRWKKLLADYQPPPLGGDIVEELQDFMAHRKESLPDIWH